MSRKTIPEHYVPRSLSKKFKKQQLRELKKSRKMYKKGKYYNRKKIPTYKNKKTSWKTKFYEIYNIPKSKSLSLSKISKITKCDKKAIKEILKKGKGAYYSSGSRPNQTPYSWAYGRLYSSLSGGPAAKYDEKTLSKGCNTSSKSLKLSKNPRKNFTRRRIKI